MATGGLVPLVLDQVRPAHHPARRRVGRRQHAAQPALRDQLEPARVLAGDVDQGGDTRLQELAVGRLRAGELARVVRPVGARALEEARHVHLGDAVLLADAAIAGLETGMRVHVDQARHDHEAAAVDGLVDAAGVAAAHVDQRVAVPRDVGPLEVGVAPVRRVPRHHPVRVLHAHRPGRRLRRRVGRRVRHGRLRSSSPALSGPAGGG